MLLAQLLPETPDHNPRNGPQGGMRPAGRAMSPSGLTDARSLAELPGNDEARAPQRAKNTHEDRATATHEEGDLAIRSLAPSAPGVRQSAPHPQDGPSPVSAVRRQFDGALRHSMASSARRRRPKLTTP